MKKCFKCKKNKNIDLFYYHGQMKDKHLNKCIDCCKKEAIKNRETKRNYYNEYDTIRYRENIYRLWKHKYLSMKRRVEGRNKHSNLLGKELLTINEFILWCEKNKKSFMAIYNKWKKAKYIRKLSPSIDRIDNKKGYVAGNMQWLTQQQNSKKYIN